MIRNFIRRIYMIPLVIFITPLAWFIAWSFDGATEANELVRDLYYMAWTGQL